MNKIWSLDFEETLSIEIKSLMVFNLMIADIVLAVNDGHTLPIILTLILALNLWSFLVLNELKVYINFC